MNFERRQDPKSAMGIGMRERIKRMMEEDNWECENDDAALKWASSKGHIEIVKFLLKVGVNVHSNHNFALRYASFYGHIEIVKLLLDAGANVHDWEDEALRRASTNGHTEVVELLKKHIEDEF